MKPPSQHLRQQTTEQVAAETAHAATIQSASVREFATPEELIRHDLLHTPVPAAVGKRLQRSLAAEPAPVRKSWWKRLL